MESNYNIITSLPPEFNKFNSLIIKSSIILITVVDYWVTDYLPTPTGQILETRTNMYDLFFVCLHG